MERIAALARGRAVRTAAAVAVTALLAGCAAGFEATSVEPYAPSDGIMADSGQIRVLNALVVATSTLSSGVISATIVNRGEVDDRLTGITSPDGTVDLTGIGDLPAADAVPLGAETDPSATITGLTKLPGETITLLMTFRRADPVTIHTVVVPATGDYASITPGPTPSSE